MPPFPTKNQTEGNGRCKKGVLLLLQARASIGNLGLLADSYQQILRS